MSDRYRPPSGPRSTRGYEDRRNPNPTSSNNNNSNSNNRNYKSSYGQRDTYTPSGPKRYQERDNYRPNSSANERSESYQPSKFRPSGPSGYRGNDRDFHFRPGSKRPHPSESKGYRGGDDYRKRQDRTDFNGPAPGPSSYRDKSSTYRNPRYDNNSYKPKVNLKNLPKGPRSGNVNDSRAKPRPYLKDEEAAPPIKLSKSQIYLIRITRPTEIYERVQQVGEGTYGKVYKATNSITDEYVALKKLRLESEREGFPITAMREIKLLQSFDHENVVGLLEMMVEHNQIYMIFDYMDHDLTGLLTHPDLKLTESHRKFIFKQLMEGLQYLHKKRVIHRDIKGSNILLDNIGRLKIADFGLARTMNVLNDGEIPDYTNRVITIWYRPPELLLGSTDYGREVDIWGVGCLLIELYSKIAAFQGFDEIGQLYKIFNVMGTPNIENWPDMENLPWFEMLKPKINKASTFKNEYESIMSEQSFDLAVKLLTLNPKKRLTAREALEHPYFTEDPKPEPLHFLKDVKGEWHEFETKKRRRKERKRLQDAKNASSQNIAQLNNGPSMDSVPDSVVPPDGPKD